MIKPKIIAWHLPQFHEIEENNKRWGKGFTEWTTVKNAKKLFKGHNQPRIPLDGYYNFLDEKTRKRQGELAKEYGIYGFCYYHYWFNGKKLLEKGLEKMLVDGQPDIKFCFSRANASWLRTWGKKIVGETLIKQEYGGKKDIHDHIAYLMNFFLNKNYILIDNKPVFVIHSAQAIPDFDQMIEYWDKYCKDNGFDGIYIIETLPEYDQVKISKLSNALVQFEPGRSFGDVSTYFNTLLKIIPYKVKSFVFRYIQIIINKLSGSKKVYKISYTNIMNKIVSFGGKKHKDKTYLGICVGRDNTPRKQERGIVFTGESPEIFKKYFEKQYKNSIDNNNEFMFVNARNEWSEGTYLEPDEKYGFGYLQAIKNIVLDKKSLNKGN